MVRAGCWLLLLTGCPRSEPSTESEVASSDGSEESGVATASDSELEAPALFPVAVQLHLHGPISEGNATYGFQDAQARAWELDALWWTEHAAMYEVDRVTSAPAWEELEDYGFSDAQLGLSAPEQDEWWSFYRQSSLELDYALEASSGPDGDAVALAVSTVNTSTSTLWAESSWTAVRAGVYRPLLSRPTLSMWLWLPEDYDPAEHGVRLVLPMSRLDEDTRVRLVLVDVDDPVTVAEPGETAPTDRSELAYGTVLVRHDWEAGAWNEVVIDLATTLADYGLDLASQGFSVHQAVRGKGALELKLSQVLLSHEVDGVDLLTAQGTLLEELGAESTVVHWAGQELGFEKTGESHHHLTAFTPTETFLLGLEDLLDTGDPRTLAVSEVHALEGVVALTHPFGLASKVDAEVDGEAEVATLCESLATHGAYGVDLIEVGYPARVLDLEEHLALWDCVSLQGQRLVGIGTSDLHNPVSWSSWDNRFCSWVWAEELDRASLIEGLRQGRVYFGDPTRVRASIARLDLRVGGASVMGQTLPLSEPITIEPRLSGVDREGLTARWVVDGERQPSHRATELPALTVQPGTEVARLELWEGSAGVLFSNPVWFTE